MARRLSALGVCLLLATMMSGAQTGQSVPLKESESSSMWFVELASPPTVDGTPVSTLEREVLSRHHFTTKARARQVVVALCQDFCNSRR